MKKKVIYVLTVLLLIASLVAPACGFEGDPMLDDLWTRNIFPGITNTYDVGSPTRQYNNGYFNNLFIGGEARIVGLQVFANNAAAIAGGLVAGDLYRTGADPDLVCVVH